MNSFTCLVKIRNWIAGTTLLLLVHSCASAPFVLPEHLDPVALESKGKPTQAIETAESTLAPPRKLPALDISNWSVEANSKWQKLGLGDQETDLNVESMPLNKFIQVALGDVLALSFSVDPAVQAMDALATNGDARILSSPRLLAVDNEEAKIQVGTQIAVISSENTSDSVDGIIRSFTYVDTGVILSFTPTVMAGGQVRLQVNQEVSVPGPSLNNTPPINTRSVQTTLIAQSGRTVMIGGLISTTDSISDQKVPLFGNIPVLGALFRGRDVVENTTEMVILITPHIIESSLQLETLTEAFRKKGGW